MDKRFYDALSSSIYMNSMALNGREIATDDQRLRAAGLYDDWKAGSHAVGAVCNTHRGGELGEEWEQTWECYQAYDNAVYPDVAPGNSAWYAFNRPLHGRSKATARPFVPVQGSHDLYRHGEYAVWTDGLTYRCVAANGTNFSPADYPDGWEAAG